MTELHRRAARKKRRVIVRLDVLGELQMQQMSGEKYLDYIFGFLENLPHQIDTILWDFLYDGDRFALYESEVLPMRRCDFLDRWRAEGFDLFGRLLERSRKNGFENFVVQRISEVSIDIVQNVPTDKFEHPERYIRSWEDLGIENMASPEIRELKIRILGELLEKYDFDGVSIDFCRHTPFLEPGHQWELRDNVTEFMRMVRALCTAREEKTGRPVLINARVPDNVADCAGDGIDVAAFAREELADMLTLGSRSHDVDIAGFREAVGADIALFPCCDAEHCSDGYMYPPIEVLRGVFCNWWQQGADGIETFNWRTTDDESRKRVMRELGYDYVEPDCHQEQAYREMGNYEIMKPLDKTFVAERRGGYPWGEGPSYDHQSKPLPLRLYNHGAEKSVTVSVADSDFRDCRSRTLDLILHGIRPQDRIAVTLNGNALQDGTYDFGWKELQVWAPDPAPESGGNIRWMMIENRNPHPDQKLLRCSFSIPAAFLSQGKNVIGVRVLRAPHDPKNNNLCLLPVPTLEKAEISLKYGGENQ